MCPSDMTLSLQLLFPVRLCPGLLSYTGGGCAAAVQGDPDCGQCPDQVVVHTAPHHDNGGLCVGHVRSICVPRRESTQEQEALGRLSHLPVLLCHLLARDFPFYRLIAAGSYVCVDYTI